MLKQGPTLFFFRHNVMGSSSMATDDSGTVNDVTPQANVEQQPQTDPQHDLRRLPGAKPVRQVDRLIKVTKEVDVNNDATSESEEDEDEEQKYQLTQWFPSDFSSTDQVRKNLNVHLKKSSINLMAPPLLGVSGIQT